MNYFISSLGPVYTDNVLLGGTCLRTMLIQLHILERAGHSVHIVPRPVSTDVQQTHTIVVEKLISIKTNRREDPSHLIDCK